jgi:dTDP-4-dehydrorhamnose reductase
MTWAITGASGQLGRSLVDLLERSGTSFVTWTKAELDISKKESIEKVIKSQSKVLVNCAAYTAVDKAESEPDQAEAINHLGAAHMAYAARELKIPFVHISTDYVFSGSKKNPWFVEDQTRPHSQYGITKLRGENAILSVYPAGSYVLRTAWLYSQYGDNFAKKILKKGLKYREKIRMVNDQIGQPTSTIDLASQIYAVVSQRPEPGIYHASNSGEGTWFDFTKELFNLAGISESLVIPITSKEFESAATRPAYSVLDGSKWETVGMSKMEDWRKALHNAFPDILKRVKEEIVNG